jgi:pimeloyl-ACP methyl ester carboxylesterase
MICILPGMGADRRMFPPPWPSLPECTFVDWPKYNGEQTLAEVAKSVVRKYTIPPGAWLVGSSLGGMVAGEIAKFLPVRGLILVGSAKTKDEVSALFNWLDPLIDLTPLNFIRQLAGKVPAELAQMFKDSDPAFVRAMCHAIVRWEGLGDTAVELHRIHGRNDRVIPLPAGVQRALDGGHLIALTHAPECVAFVRSIVADTGSIGRTR